MREIIQCLLCASVGFITASLLAAGKHNSTTEADIDNSPQTNIISEIPSANTMSEIHNGI